ncbi:hypothetical protein ACIBTV_27755 [Micromonospora sp. NPDC049366]|uniref:hypothetical protein n=1 Tax=Micromonospora sp. NPDC049366 TaxID=3364271 RepID=UPI0037920AFC
MSTARSRADQVRDLIMLVILVFWMTYGGAALVQLFTSSAKVLESLPPYWFWGIPLVPYGALYGTLPRVLTGGQGEPQQPAPPTPSEPTT